MCESGSSGQTAEMPLVVAPHAPLPLAPVDVGHRVEGVLPRRGQPRRRSSPWVILSRGGRITGIAALPRRDGDGFFDLRRLHRGPVVLPPGRNVHRSGFIIIIVVVAILTLLLIIIIIDGFIIDLVFDGAPLLPTAPIGVRHGTVAVLGQDPIILSIKVQGACQPLISDNTCQLSAVTKLPRVQGLVKPWWYAQT